MDMIDRLVIVMDTLDRFFITLLRYVGLALLALGVWLAISGITTLQAIPAVNPSSGGLPSALVSGLGAISVYYGAGLILSGLATLAIGSLAGSSLDMKQELRRLTTQMQYLVEANARLRTGL